MTTPAENSSEREIVISRVFDAPRELVWEAMTDPARVTHWWGPHGFSTTTEKMEVRPGGTWRHVMHGPDGTDYPNTSVFTEVVKPERIVYVHTGSKAGAPGVQFVATWLFNEVAGGKTELVLRQVYDSVEARDTTVRVYGAVEGGKQTFARLAEFLAAQPLVVERLLETPMPVVWSALTDIAEMKKWYLPMLKDFRPELGFETEFDVVKNGRLHPHLWKVTEVVPGRKLTYRWKYGGNPGESFVSFELFDESGKTRLRLTHIGLETFGPETHPEYARSNFNGGWTHFINAALPDYLAKKD